MHDVADAADIYPRPGDPLFAAIRANGTDPIPQFGDESWDLRSLSHNPTAETMRVNWAKVPAQFRVEIRYLAWALINRPLDDDVLHNLAPQWRSSLSPWRIYVTIYYWRKFAEWASDEGFERLGGITAGDIARYVAELIDRRQAFSSVNSQLAALVRLWAYSVDAPFEDFARPPWLEDGEDLEDYLPAGGPHRGIGGDGGPIAPEVIAPLLKAAITVLDYADSIQALTERGLSIARWAKRPAGGEKTGRHLDEWFAEIRAEGLPVPVKRHRGAFMPDIGFIAESLGVSYSLTSQWILRSGIRQYAKLHMVEESIKLHSSSQDELNLMPLQWPIAESRRLANLLDTACFIVIAYLTGMRPGEVLALEHDSLRVSTHEGASWHLIKSRHFKPVVDENGAHDSAGQVRAAPWIAVAPVTRAIRVMESMSADSQFLFQTRTAVGVKESGRIRTRKTVVAGIERFSSWVNGRLPGFIPEDPYGAISAERFRPTLAWHIANRPNGIVALAVQYGHVYTAISEGYASRVRDGIDGLVDIESAKTIARNLMELRERLAEGEGVSGPAARRLVAATEQVSHKFRGNVLSRRQAKAIVSDPTLAAHQNPNAMCWCMWSVEKAQCISAEERSVANGPKLDRCVPCANRAFSDTNAEALLAEIEVNEGLAEVSPPMLGGRFLATAESLRVRFREHERTKFTIVANGDMEDD